MIVYIVRTANNSYDYSFNPYDAIHTIYSLDELISYHDTMEFITSVVKHLNEGNIISCPPNSCIQSRIEFDPSNMNFIPLAEIPVVETERVEYIQMMRSQKNEREKTIFIMNDDEDHLENFYYNVWLYIKDLETSLQITEILLNLKEVTLREFIPDLDDVIILVDKHICIDWLSVPKYDNPILQTIYERLINCITRERKGLSCRSLCFDIHKTEDNSRYSTYHELRIQYNYDAFELEEDYLLPVDHPRLYNIDFKIKAFPRQIIKIFTESEIQK